MPMPDVLDFQIRSLVTELIESAPGPPLLQFLGGVVLEADRGRRIARRRGAFAISGGVVVAAIAATLTVTLLLPVSGRFPVSEAAAAQLRQIALNAAAQPRVAPGQGQWLKTVQTGSFFAQVSQVGSTPTPDAQATVTATIDEWSNDTGDSCVSATTSPAQFASPANEAAWKAAGLLVDPTSEPIEGCSSVEGATASNGVGQGVGVTDVSGLPTDPSVLAEELKNGTTGIEGLDQISTGNQDAGFIRAVLILIGPTTGGSPSFYSALYGALALLPGVESLGQVTTHSGSSGVGFAAASGVGRSLIVVDSSTGALLEARNIDDPLAFAPLNAAYTPKPLPPPAAPPPGTDAQGGASKVMVQWLDTVGSTSVVSGRSLPSGITPPVSSPVTGTITAKANSDVTYSEIASLENSLGRAKGVVASTYETQDSSGFPGGATVTLTLDCSPTLMEDIVTELRVSELFSSVDLQQVNGSS
jgi:hypothetical protein